MNFSGETIWVIGASCGIGKALAAELANQGATVILSARRQDELEKVNAELGGNHIVQAFDASEYEQVAAALESLKGKVKRIDRVIMMAAIYRPNDIDQLDITFATEQVRVNIMAAINVSFAVLPVFDEQKGGQLVLCGSVAGFVGLPGGQPYCATKAAVNNFAESLYAEVPDYVDVKLITPGFVRTRMTDKNKFDMPMRIEPEEAAKHIAKGLKARSFDIHFPKAFTLIMKSLRLLPYGLSLKITRAMRGKA